MAKCTGMRCPMQYGYNVEECNQTDCPYRTEPVTNADKIRAMSDEELSVFLWGFEKEEICREGEFFIKRRKLNEWLKQTAE